MAVLEREIIKGGRIATLRDARRQWNCNHCHLPILIRSPYYEVVEASAGVIGKLSAEHVHTECIYEYLKIPTPAYQAMMKRQVAREIENCPHCGGHAFSLSDDGPTCINCGYVNYT